MTFIKTAVRRVTIAAAAIVLGGAITTPTASQAAPASLNMSALATPAGAIADLGASEEESNGRMGVWANIYNRSGTTEFTVRNRNTWATWTVKPHQSQAWPSPRSV